MPTDPKSAKDPDEDREPEALEDPLDDEDDLAERGTEFDEEKTVASSAIDDLFDDDVFDPEGPDA